MNKTSNSALAGSSSPSPNLLGKKCIWPGGHSMIVIIIRMITIIMFIVIMTRMMSIIVLTFLLLNMPRCVIGLFEATRWTKQYQAVLFWDFLLGLACWDHKQSERWITYAIKVPISISTSDPFVSSCWHFFFICLVTLTIFLHSTENIPFSNTSAESTLSD